MKRVLAKPAVRRGLMLVVLVILAAGGLGAYSQVTAFSYTDLKDALRAGGATLQESGDASALTFQGTGHGLRVNGAQVVAYEYGTTVAAQLDAARVSPDGSTFRDGIGPFGGKAVSVDWIAPPHHFKKGRVIVTYIGDDVAIMRLLTSVLGPQFAGGAVPTGGLALLRQWGTLHEDNEAPMRGAQGAMAALVEKGQGETYGSEEYHRRG
jgi:hypothetical protein